MFKFKAIYFSTLMVLAFAFVSCSKESNPAESVQSYPAVTAKFGNKIDLNSLENYANQPIPSYINKDNTNGNSISDKGATLGRILFYDKNLSTNNSIACASCHLQANGFSDKKIVSDGVNGTTKRHSMRLVNSRFSNEVKFFWDERAATLEQQTTKPIQDHAEMGYSGLNGDQALSDMMAKLETIDYYKELFTFVYGDSKVTEDRLQKALAQFVRSIQSFDSKFDAGRTATGNDNQNFANFTAQENQGKTIFINPPQQGGAGCQGCHAAPEFDIAPNTGNNGIVGVVGKSGEIDISNTKAPSLRNIFNSTGELNGPLMHDGSLSTVAEVINHYNLITVEAGNTNLDPKLLPGGQPQKLNLTQAQKDALAAFLKTLSGSEVYTASKWSDPFLN